MKQQVSRTGLAVAIFLIALSLAVAILSLAAIQRAAAGPGILGSLNEGSPELYARRVITPTFGINSPLDLSDDGTAIDVTGHGECPEGGKSFQIVVTVTQDSTGAKAKGRTQGDCPEGSFEWSALAEVLGPTTFEEGENTALVCAHAVIHVEKGGAVVQQWCREEKVTLN